MRCSSGGVNVLRIALEGVLIPADIDAARLCSSKCVCVCDDRMLRIVLEGVLIIHTC